MAVTITHQTVSPKIANPLLSDECPLRLRRQIIAKEIPNRNRRLLLSTLWTIIVTGVPLPINVVGQPFEIAIAGTSITQRIGSAP